MKNPADAELLRYRIGICKPDVHPQQRLLALYSAAIATASESTRTAAVQLAQKHRLAPNLLYEIVLQSYLFLGFPRMLEAADHLARHGMNPSSPSQLEAITPVESAQWYEQGLLLCQQVYGKNFEKLKERIEVFAPEIFRWMVIEGYGKVLSRPQLPISNRELAVIASLMIDQRERQLHSHMLGALNVGVPIDLIRLVIDDIGDAAGDGFLMATAICNKMVTK